MKYIVFFSLLQLCIAHSHTVIGVLKGEKEVVIKAKSQGELKEIKFKEGQFVKAGDIIAVIDNEKESLESDMAYNDYLLASKEYQKSKKLKEYLSDDELNKKRNDYLKKKKLYEIKKYNLASKNITTPISGIVAKEFIKQGENVSSGAKAYEVIKYDMLEIDLYVNGKYLKKLELGKKLNLKHELDKQKIYSGEITFISPVLDKTSGTVHVKLKLKNHVDSSGNFQLRPGAMVKVKIE